MNNLTPFPWHYFIRTIRSKIILVWLASLITFIVCQLYQEYVFPKVLIVIVAFTTLAIIQGYFKILPFIKMLKKIDEIQVQLPHNKKLNIIYQKNEWVLIQEMLKLTEKYIRDQSQQIFAQEQQSHTVLESIPDPIIIVDRYLNCKQYNNEFKKIFIKNKETKLFKDEKLWKIFEEDKLLLNIFKQAESTHQMARASALKIEDQFFNISVTPFFDDQNKNIGLLGLFHNVTDTKLSEKMRVDFVANVSHEIRTPLTAIKGFSQILLAQKEKCSPELHPPLERIVVNTEKLKDLFDNLLKLSFIESQFEIQKTQIDLEKLIKSIVTNLKAKYPQQNIKVEIQPHMFIWGDHKLLEHALTNILDNSIKYNRSQTAIISVQLNNNQKDKDQIQITDNGPGIPESDLKRIFERFYRIQGQSHEKIEGSGIGLSIVKHVINKHNGYVSVESKINQGTIFKINLPKLETQKA
ncbi:MAG: ATP-binding protein [Bacteriovoracaceae bacterium]|jgi:two-component system phosphate regulon sensor histidine kinase PhoR|nr:ATP-binding protein [Bacteriovoracaceae bacterium]